MLVLIVILVLLLAILDAAKKRRTYPDIPTVQPLYPVVGNVLNFVGQNMEERLQTLTDIFNAGPRLFKLWLGPTLLVGVGHPELFQKLLTDPNCMEKPYIYDFINMKYGLISARYDFWKISRKVLNPTMNLRFLHDSIAVFERCSRVMVERLKTCSKPGEAVNLLPFTMQCSLEMICATTMGSVVLGREDSQQFMESTEKYFKLVASRMLNFWLHNDLVFRQTEHFRETWRLRKLCLDFALKTIQERRAILQDKSHEENSPTGPKILIDQVLTTDINREMTDQSLSEQIWVLVAAGSDTSAHGVAHACLILAIYPELQDRLFEEIEAAHPADEPITPETFKNLPFLDAFFKECLRVAPLGPIISRTNLAPVELDGYRFPQGTIFLMNFCDLHRRRDIWGPEPDRFDPDHFLLERQRQRHPYSYLPFSAGSRNCIGWRYAMMNAKVMLIHIVRNFRMSTTIKYEDLRFEMGITLQLAFKHMITLEERNRS